MRVGSDCEGCDHCSYEMYDDYGCYDPDYYCDLDECCHPFDYLDEIEPDNVDDDCGYGDLHD